MLPRPWERVASSTNDSDSPDADVAMRRQSEMERAGRLLAELSAVAEVGSDKTNKESKRRKKSKNRKTSSCSGSEASCCSGSEASCCSSEAVGGCSGHRPSAGRDESAGSGDESASGDKPGGGGDESADERGGDSDESGGDESARNGHDASGSGDDGAADLHDPQQLAEATDAGDTKVSKNKRMKLKKKAKKKANKDPAKETVEGDDAAGVDDVESSNYTMRAKRRSKPLKEELQQAVERAKARGIKTVCPKFGTYVFPDFASFEAAWCKYKASTLSVYRKKHTLRREDKNTKIKVDYAKREQKAKAKGVKFTEKEKLIPEKMSHFEMTMVCVHGNIPSARGTGKRYPAATRYTGCGATIHAKATCAKATGEWCVTVDNENSVHNHALTEAVFESYENSSLITDDVLFNEVASMLASEGNTRIICDIISKRLGRTFTTQQLSNFRNYRLGGTRAVQSMKNLLEEYIAFDGTRILIIRDEEGLMIGLALQSAIQREMLVRWGDSLLLDWTHNTNNAGYYLGALMCTTVNGTGVSIMDFLSLTQSKDMMRAIFRQLIEWEPRVVASLRSIVIDKDYNEWAVLEEVFPNADVVLCQFHVLKWFKQVIRLGKYGIASAVRDKVMGILRAQVYAVDADAFAHQQMRLVDLLSSPSHQVFLKYMQDRWYSCIRMWSYACRGKIFTAANTTTNRLEAFWRRFKEALGKKQRIDLCVEAIFLHATAVLRREKTFLVDFVGKTALHTNLDPFLASLVSDLSEYSVGHIRAQFAKFKSSTAVGDARPYNASPVTPGSKHYKVCVVGERRIEEEVNVSGKGPWTCSCSFFKGSSLPCRHIFFVANKVEEMDEFPLSALAPRWKLSEAATLLGALEVGIDQVATLRIPRQRKSAVDDYDVGVPDDTCDASAVDEEWASSVTKVGETLRGRIKPVVLVTLRRGEVGGDVVIGDIEKFNTISTQLNTMVEYMKAQGSARFRMCVVELDAVIAALMMSWQKKPEHEEEQPQCAEHRNEVEKGTEHTVGVQPSQDLSDYDAAYAVDIGETPDPESEQRAFVFDEDYSDSPAADIQSLTASPKATHSVRFPRVHTPIMTPGDAQVFGDFDFDDIHQTARDTALAAIDAATPFLPLTPPPSVMQEFQRQRRSTHPQVHISSFHDMLNDYEDDDLGFEPAAPASDAPVQNAFYDGLPESQKRILREIDDELTAEETARLSDTANNSAVSGDISRAKRKLDDLHASDTVATNSLDIRTDPRSTKQKCIEGANPDISSIVVQAPLGAGNRHRAGQTSVVGRRRQTPVRQGSECPVYLEDLLLAIDYANLPVAKAAALTYDVKLTETLILNRGASAKKEWVVHDQDRTNFIVPEDVYKIMNSAITLAKEEDGTSDISEDVSLRGSDREQYVARVSWTNGVRTFSEYSLFLFREFYERQRLFDLYKNDMQWVKSDMTWSVPSRRDLRAVPFLQAEADECEGPVDPNLTGDVPSSDDTDEERELTEAQKLTQAEERKRLIASIRTRAMREEVRSVLEASARETKLSIPGRKGQIDMKTLIGRVARATLLNDVAIYFSLSILASAYDDVVVIDSLSVGKFSLPVQALKHTRVVVFPINMNDTHWGVIIVCQPTKPDATAVIYEALGSVAWADKLSVIWRTWCLPLLASWSTRDHNLDGAIVDLTRYLHIAWLSKIKEEYPTKPRQRDGTSCGLYVILHAYSYMLGSTELRNADSFNVFQVKMVRLRLLWYILTRSERTIDSSRVATSKATMKTLSAYTRS